MRIKKYEIDRVVDPDDILIGSDSGNPGMPTRNYRIGDLIEFIRNEGVLSGLLYLFDPGNPASSGKMDANSIHFKQITSLSVSRLSYSGKDYGPALNTFVSNASLLKISNPNQTDYGFYKVNSFSVHENGKLYNLEVELINTFGFGSLVAGQVYDFDLEPLISIEGVFDVNHNSTKGIQGGDVSSSEYYHLTKKQYDWLKISIEKIPPPSYLPPSLSFSGENKIVEMGSTIELNLSAFFTKNDSGDLISIIIEKRNDLGSWDLFYNGSSTTAEEVEIRKRLDYRSKAIYGEGPCKENELGEVDCRGRITSGELVSDLISVTPYYKYFFGESTEDVALSEDVRALHVSGFDIGGELNVDFVLTKGKRQFFLFVRSDRKVSKVVDLSIQGIEITKAYKEVDGDFEVADAGGDLVAYRKYKFSLSDGYAENHTHRVTIKNN